MTIILPPVQVSTLERCFCEEQINMKRLIQVIVWLSSLSCFGQNNSLKIDITNKNFVRFLCLGEFGGGANFSVSLEKITPPNSKTEPFTTFRDWRETDILVDNFTYSKFKNYFLTHKYQSHTNSKKKKENQLEINIDFKYRSYIPADDAIIILKNFIKYIQQEKIQGNFTEQLNYR
jgi:hypothetical protein